MNIINASSIIIQGFLSAVERGKDVYGNVSMLQWLWLKYTPTWSLCSLAGGVGGVELPQLEPDGSLKSDMGHFDTFFFFQSSLV